MNDSQFDLVLPTAVDVREVGMRDGLQLEEPVALADKLAMLEALVATGVPRIEVTSFVSPKAVPALADADQLAAELHRFDGVHFSALVANLRGAQRASTWPNAAAACCSSPTSTYSSTACMTAGVPGPQTTIGASPTTGRSTDASVK